ncbi:aKG-HExxH-type peptide beta-hydroxylase [Streptomyces reniochalinae]|nr:HEXXH motif-containing putative peptide modification protein [Streptomyces reniochalinae]
MTPFDIPDPQLRRMGETRPLPREAAALGAWLHSRRLVLLKALLTRVERARPPARTARALDAHWALLEQAESNDPAAARSALGYPAVGNWLARTLEAGPEGLPAALAGSGPLAAAVATAAGTAFQIDLPTSGGRLTLPGLGTFLTDAPCVRLEAAGGDVSFTPQSGRTVRLPRAAVLGHGYDAEQAPWRPLRGLPGGFAVLDDRDPHLGDGTREAGLGGLRPVTLTAPGEADVWHRMWKRALRLLREADRERAAEVTGLVRSLVPVLWKPQGRASATRMAAPWAVLATRPHTPEELAEVLVHEVQHSKLAVLEGVVRLSRPGTEAVFQVGWRSDPRPLDAVLQGTYAHLALADLWDRLARRAAATPAERAAARGRRADFLTQVDHALFLLLGSGQLTRQGTEFVEGMRRRHARLTASGGRDARGVAVAADKLTNGHFG